MMVLDKSLIKLLQLITFLPYVLNTVSSEPNFHLNYML